MVLIPNKKNIDSAISLKDEMLTWREIYSLIIKEFQKYNKNIKLREVAYKIELVNKLYNCNLMMPKEKVAKYIIDLKLDNKLTHSNPSIIVEEISNIKLPDYLKSIGLVFASKYCHFHHPSRFPIYDKFAGIGLSQLFGKKLNYYEKNYSKFKIDLDTIISSLSWESSYKEMDKLLWLYGQWISYKIGKTKQLSNEIKALIEKEKDLFSNLEP